MYELCVVSETPESKIKNLKIEIERLNKDCYCWKDTDGPHCGLCWHDILIYQHTKKIREISWQLAKQNKDYGKTP